MNTPVKIDGDRVFADSRDVADQFGKRHADTLRAIKNLLAKRPELERNFVLTPFPVAVGCGGTRMDPRFDMDRSGFMLLVMSFTGEKALDLKVSWVKAFEKMEQMLTGSAEQIVATRVIPELSGVELRDKLHFVRAAYLASRSTAARRAWQMAGLPDLFGADPVFVASPHEERRRAMMDAMIDSRAFGV